MQLLMPLLLAKNVELANLENLIAGFGDGSDGEITAGATIDIPAEDEYTAIIQATRVHIPAGQTLTVNKRCRGLIIYSQSDVIVDGTIDMNYRGAKVSKESSVQKHLEIPIGSIVYSVPTGGKGGDGGAGGSGTGTYAGAGGSAMTGTLGTWFGGGFGGGGGGGGGGGCWAAGGDSFEGGRGGDAGSNNLDLPVQVGIAHCGGKGSDACDPPYGAYGGEGGGGGGIIAGPRGTGRSVGTDGSPGGLPGGLVLIAAKGDIQINGIIRANGQDGGNGGNGGNGGTYSDWAYGGSGGGGSGGGGGGVIVIACRGSYINNGSIFVNAGSGSVGGVKGLKAGSGTDGANGFPGTAGSIGTIAVMEV